MNRVKPLENAQTVEKALETLENRHSKYGVLFAVGLETGLRISDILRLRVCDAEGGQVIIREQKTGKVKALTLSAETRERIHAHVDTHKLRPTDYLVYSREHIRDKPLSRRHAWEVLKGLEGVLGVKGIGTHTMRKTFAKGVLGATESVLEVQKALGHTQLATTLGYIADPAQLTEALRVVIFGQKK